jgi:DNA-binding PadR family transcriptional regulator
MNSRNLTEVEAVIMKAISAFDVSAPTGEDIASAVHTIRGREIKYAVLYSALHRMAVNGLITHTPGEPTMENGAVHRKFHYSLTEKGRAELAGG